MLVVSARSVGSPQRFHQGEGLDGRVGGRVPFGIEQAAVAQRRQYAVQIIPPGMYGAAVDLQPSAVTVSITR